MIAVCLCLVMIGAPTADAHCQSDKDCGVVESCFLKRCYFDAAKKAKQQTESAMLSFSVFAYLLAMFLTLILVFSLCCRPQKTSDSTPHRANNNSVTDARTRTSRGRRILPVQVTHANRQCVRINMPLLVVTQSSVDSPPSYLEALSLPKPDISSAKRNCFDP